uniref:Uncharacterized protein n=1 Tax=Oryza rufipogon TaxID=4529 RepID=A0A0E0R7V9_ORYRU
MTLHASVQLAMTLHGEGIWASSSGGTGDGVEVELGTQVGCQWAASVQLAMTLHGDGVWASSSGGTGDGVEVELGTQVGCQWAAFKEMFDGMEVHTGKAFKERIAAIKTSPTDLTAASPSPLPASPTSAPTWYSTFAPTTTSFCPNNNIMYTTASSCHFNKKPILEVALELGDHEEKAHALCIDTIGCFKDMHAKCSTFGLETNGDANQAVVMSPTIIGMSKIIPASVVLVDIFSPTDVSQCQYRQLPCYGCVTSHGKPSGNHHSANGAITSHGAEA